MHGAAAGNGEARVLMWTYRVERVIRAEPDVVHRGIACLVERAWGERSRVVFDDGVANRSDAISVVPGGDEADVWLTWHLTATTDGTRVELLLDEVEPGPDPTSTLDDVLDLLSRTSSSTL